MKLIDLLSKIANNEIEPPLYFRLNTAGYNFIIKYLYYAFIIEDVELSSFKKGEKFNLILYSLDKTIEILDKENNNEN